MTTPFQITQSFVPTQVPGCQLWFDAADSTTFTYSSGTNISEWRDKSSNKYTVIQPATDRQPSLTERAQNSLPGIQFASNYYLYQTSTSMPNFTTGSSTSVLMAARNASNNDSWNIINTIWFTSSGSGATTRYHFSFNRDATDGTTLFANGSLVGQVTSNAVAPSANAILGFTASASSATIHTNGSTNSYSGVTLPNATGSSAFVFNDPRNNAASANTMIFEMVGYNTQITTAERQQLEGYLAWKWGMVSNLPADHPYKTTPILSLPPFPNAPRVGFATNQPIPLPFPLLPQISYATTITFNPNSISVSSLWLDAADAKQFTVSGSTITAVTDKSVSPKTISITNTVSYTTNQAIVFTDTNGRFNIASMPTAPYDYIFVGTANSSSATWRTMLRTGGIPGTHPFLLQSGTNNAGMWDSVGFQQFGSLTQTTSEKAMFYGSMASNRTITASKNGTISLTAASPAGNESIITTVGNNSTGLQPYGQLHEIIIYSTTLSLFERQQVEGYLAWKWGLQSNLPGNHPYKLFPPVP
jgi:hypothetical protein